MRYAIFSDIHANLQAWKQVASDADSVGADVFVCLGDVVGYGPKPFEVLSAIRQRTGNFVLGNHDAAVTGALDASIFNDQAREVVEWTRGKLDPESIEFLAEVPLSIEADDLLFVHAEVEEPGRFHYIEDVNSARDNLAATEHRLIFVGHTHHPTVFVEKPGGTIFQAEDQDFQLSEGHRYLVNVGSAGEPRNPEDIRARYVIYDSDTRTVFFRRLEFDVEAYRADLIASGLRIRPFFLQLVDHMANAEAASVHAIEREMREPIRPVMAVTRRPQKIVYSSIPVVTRPPTARARPAPPPPRKSRTGLAVFWILFLPALGAGAWWWFRQSNPMAEDAATALPPPVLNLRNGGFEEPLVKDFALQVPENWDGLGKDAVELAERSHAAFEDFDAADGNQVLTLRPGGAVCQPLGSDTLRPGLTYRVGLAQYEQTNIKNKGGGLRVELWDGHPALGGVLLVHQDFPATGAGKSTLQEAHLQIPAAPTVGTELYLCLRNIPNSVNQNTGNVSVDDVTFLGAD